MATTFSTLNSYRGRRNTDSNKARIPTAYIPYIINPYDQIQFDLNVNFWDGANVIKLTKSLKCNKYDLGWQLWIDSKLAAIHSF